MNSEVQHYIKLYLQYFKKLRYPWHQVFLSIAFNIFYKPIDPQMSVSGLLVKLLVSQLRPPVFCSPLLTAMAFPSLVVGVGTFL